MNLSYLINQDFESDRINFLDCDELIFSVEKISRRSLIKKEAFENFQCSSSIRKVCEFDVLLNEDKFENYTNFYQSLRPESFDCVRAQDFGVINWIFENTDKKIQLNLETGHHNFDAIEVWMDYLGDRLQKIILSYELPIETLKVFAKKIRERGIEVEILGLGQILLFYSPRKLLSRIQGMGTSIEADSLESPHKGFHVNENENGTFMYHLKDLNLFSFIEDTDFMSLFTLRVELKKYMSLPFKENLSFNLENYPRKTSKGYSIVNKSDVLFNKLKNQHLNLSKEQLVGEVISVGKPDYLLVNCLGKREIIIGSEIKLISPEGIEKVTEINRLRDINNNEIDSSEGQTLVMIPYMKKMTPKTIVFVNFN